MTIKLEENQERKLGVWWGYSIIRSMKEVHNNRPVREETPGKFAIISVQAKQQAGCVQECTHAQYGTKNGNREGKALDHKLQCGSRPTITRALHIGQSLLKIGVGPNEKLPSAGDTAVIKAIRQWDGVWIPTPTHARRGGETYLGGETHRASCV